MPAFTQVKTLSRAVPAFTQVKILSRAVSWKKSVPAVKMASRATHVLGLAPIFKWARQKDKCKRAVQCRAEKKWHRSKRKPCPKRYSVNGALNSLPLLDGPNFRFALTFK